MKCIMLNSAKTLNDCQNRSIWAEFRNFRASGRFKSEQNLFFYEANQLCTLKVIYKSGFDQAYFRRSRKNLFKYFLC